MSDYLFLVTMDKVNVDMRFRIIWIIISLVYYSPYGIGLVVPLAYSPYQLIPINR